MTLQKFKERIDKEQLADLSIYNDLYLLRFLRARKFDLELAYEMFKKFIDWRKENNVDDIEVIINYIEIRLLRNHGCQKNLSTWLS